MPPLQPLLGGQSSPYFLHPLVLGQKNSFDWQVSGHEPDWHQLPPLCPVQRFWPAGQAVVSPPVVPLLQDSPYDMHRWELPHQNCVDGQTAPSPHVAVEAMQLVVVQHHRWPDGQVTAPPPGGQFVSLLGLHVLLLEHQYWPDAHDCGHDCPAK